MNKNGSTTILTPTLLCPPYLLYPPCPAYPPCTLYPPCPPFPFAARAKPPFLTGERTAEGYYGIRSGLEAGIARALAYAPYADLLWLETKTPDLEEARRFADSIHEQFPDKMLAYNCSPSFNWRKKLDDATIARFQRELGVMGYKFQFITLAGWHLVNYHTFELAHEYRQNGMSAYSDLQNGEFAAEVDGYTSTKHQREVGTAYFDRVLNTISGGTASTGALAGSTEMEQFQERYVSAEK